MEETQFKELIIKFLNEDLLESEEELFLELLKEEENKNLFEEFIRLNFLLEASLHKKELIELPRVLLSTSLKTRRKHWLKPAISVAAIALILIGIVMFMKFSTTKVNIFESLEVDHNNITITLPDGSLHNIVMNESFMLKDSMGNRIAKTEEDILIFDDVLSEESSSITNAIQTINVPYGQSLRIQLPDNSRVHMNAGSTLELPISFTDKEVREINAYGEIYFEVEPNAKKFITHIDDVVIEVLGTSFAINSYIEDKEPTVVLVEGKVALRKNDGEESIHLVADELGTFSTEQGRFIKKKVNTQLYTAWMKGELVFREESFINILNKLERKYNVTFVSESEALNTQVFNASFKSGESIENILMYFKEIFDLEYKIKNDTITIINP